MSQSPIRGVFFDKLGQEFYSFVSNSSLFKGWDVRELYNLSESIVASKTTEINKFLDASNFSLKEMDTAIARVIREILYPEVEKLRI